jgi:hypothetical protein
MPSTMISIALTSGLMHWIDVVYNTERIHSAIDYHPPIKFEVAFPSQGLLSFRDFDPDFGAHYSNSNSTLLHR